MPLSRDIDDVIGRMLMVGVRGASLEDPQLHEDLAACREARAKGVILFDVDLPTASALERQGLGRAEARRRAARNIRAPAQTAALCETIREALGDDVLIAVDQEGGRVARLSPERGFDEGPTPEAFGGMDSDGRVRAARELARQVARAGFNLDFAPCVDVGLNRESPIIARLGRAFSSDERLVTACAATVIDALHEVGVGACLKHFPGHGSALDDSHDGLPDITACWDARRELFPYELLLRLPPEDARAGFVMTGHLFHREVDSGHPASLSRAWTTGVLRERLGFQGVVVVDSLDMGAIAGRYSPEDALVLAVNAGADLLLDCNNAPSLEGRGARRCPAPEMARALRRALEAGRLEGGPDRLDASAERIARSRRPPGEAPGASL